MTVDKELIQRCQQGDQAAFELLVKKHERRVFGLVYQMVRQPSEVEDIAQEVFTKIYFSLPQFRIEASFEAWLYRITVNQCYDYLRKRKREAQVTESDLSDEEAAFFERFGSITQPRHLDISKRLELQANRGETFECVASQGSFFADPERNRRSVDRGADSGVQIFGQCD